jgi:hypothetical protein
MIKSLKSWKRRSFHLDGSKNIEGRMNEMKKMLNPVLIMVSIVCFVLALLLMAQLDISCFVAGLLMWIASIKTAKLIFNK